MRVVLLVNWTIVIVDKGSDQVTIFMVPLIGCNLILIEAFLWRKVVKYKQSNIIKLYKTGGIQFQVRL
jgi:hypothetical protein